MATTTYVGTQIQNATANMATTTYVDQAIANHQVNLTGYATESWVTTQINNATASIVTDVWYYGPTAPDNGKTGSAQTKARKLLWIDSNTSTGGLKYFNGSSWVHVPVAWQ